MLSWEFTKNSWNHLDFKDSIALILFTGSYFKSLSSKILLSSEQFAKSLSKINFRLFNLKAIFKLFLLKFYMVVFHDQAIHFQSDFLQEQIFLYNLNSVCHTGL